MRLIARLAAAAFLAAAGAARPTVIPILFDPAQLGAPAPQPPAGPPTILFVGRLAPHKRQDELIAAFSPDTESGFKRVGLVAHGTRGYSIGFLTKEFSVDRGNGREPMLAVYVPTNNLYLGDVIVCPRDNAMCPAITVEEGIRICLTGGVALPPNVKL